MVSTDAAHPASMRPRQSSLGIHAEARCDVAGGGASMRPRQSSLGIWSARSSCNCLLQPASMRPRQSSLGISSLPTSMSSTRVRFNEAEAIKPRNRVRPRASPNPPGNPRFNEAEAIKPRNRMTTMQTQRRRPCFNEAEAIKPRNLSGRTT